jgi:hypothetical protein
MRATLVGVPRGSSLPDVPPSSEVPDVRDGLTRAERVVLTTLAELERELGGRSVRTAMLYGRVVERCPMSVDELQRIIGRFSIPR